MRLQGLLVLKRLGLPDVTGHVPLLAALAIDALGSGVFLPLAVLFFTVTTPLSIAEVGLGLSVAAGVALPAGPILGSMVDRSGARRILLAGNLLQAVGVASYLVIDTFAGLVLAAVTVALGTQAFWAAYSPLLTQISEVGERERWFGLLGALRNAGFGLGGLLSGVVVILGGTAGYRGVVAVNATSFLLAAALLLLYRSHPGPAVDHDAEPSDRAAGWRAVLSDRPYLALTVVHVAFAMNSFALTVVLPVYAVTRLGLPAWLPGVGLTLNCLLIAVAQGPVIHALTGRARVRALRASSALSATFAITMLAAAAVPPTVAVVLVLTAVAIFTLGELVESPVLAALASEAAPDTLRGRYLALNQVSWNLSNTLAPAMLTALLAAGTWPVWAALIALAAVAALGITAVSTRLPAARQLIGQTSDPAHAGIHAPGPDESSP